MNQVYIIGHKKPDTDSICSVIGHAEFLNHFENGRYIPTRCGEINPETEFVLNKFGVEPPQYIESVEPNISDLPFTYAFSATSDIPIIDIVAMMDEHGVRNIPITDNNGAFVGLVSEHGLARAYVTRQKIEQLSFAPIKLETLARILNGKIIVPSDDLLEGRGYIAIDALHVTLSRLRPNDVAIVGDNEPSQLALISAGIAALIIADSAPIGERVIAEAEKRGVALLSTTLDAFGVGKMINLSLPASRIMATDVPTVTMQDTIVHAKHLVANSRYRTACVVGDGNKLLGMISRNTFMQDVQKQVILLDHNEYAQAVDGIENAEIMEIIDHHRLGAISTLKPVKFLNEPVGSTSTIIAIKFRDAGRTPKKSTAGLLLSGILSDTMVLRLSTTTEKDEDAVRYLAEITGVDPIIYGTELIEKGMNFEGCSIETLLTRDMKRYDLFKRNVMISQVMVPTFDFCESHADEIRTETERLRVSTGSDIFITLFTSVFENASEVFAAATDNTILSKLEITKQPARLESVMSRKNDFLPHFGSLLKNI